MNKQKMSQSVKSIGNIAGKTFVVVAAATVAVLAVILAVKAIGFVALKVLWPLAKAAFGLTFSGLFGIFLPYQLVKQLVKRTKHFKAGYERATKVFEKKKEEKQ